jgi:hypothetical protein
VPGSARVDIACRVINNAGARNPNQPAQVVLALGIGAVAALGLVGGLLLGAGSAPWLGRWPPLLSLTGTAAITPDEREALLAGSPHGCAEAIMMAHGFTIGTLHDLVRGHRIASFHALQVRQGPVERARRRSSSSSVSADPRSRPRALPEWTRGRRLPPASSSRRTRTCCATPAVTRWPTRGTIPGQSKGGSAIGRSPALRSIPRWRGLGNVVFARSIIHQQAVASRE